MINNSGQSAAMIWRNTSVTYGELQSHIDSYSDYLKEKSIEKVAIFSENRFEWVYAFYATWKNSAVSVPLDFMATAEEIRFILNDCRPEVLFCSNKTLDIVEKFLSGLTYSIEVVNFDTLDVKPANDAPRPWPKHQPSDTAVIIYTSGTTGTPKGVMVTYDNLLANVEAVSQIIPIYTSARPVLVLLPLHHIFPLVGTMVAPLCVGAPMAFSPSMTSDDIMSTLQQNGVKIIIGVPRLYSAISKGIMEKINASPVARSLFAVARAADSRSLSRRIFKKVHDKFGGRVDYLVSGGARLDEQTARNFKTLGFEILEGYGMTEAAPMITFTRPGKSKIGSAGQLMPNLEVRFQDGEILAKGRNISPGYFNRPDENRAAFQDGWLKTGDLGRIDGKGRLYITGRSKELIVLSNGKNVDPVQVEQSLSRISDCIAEVGVFMENDALHAIIYPDFKYIQQHGILNIQDKFRWDVIDKYNKTAPSYRRIKKFVLLKEELPKTRLGKLQRFKLPELNAGIENKAAKDIEEPEFEEYQVIRDYLSRQTMRRILPEDHFEIDLGLDSLDKISFQTFCQSTFGIHLKDDTLINHPTVLKLAELMKEQKKRLTVEAVKWAEIFRDNVELNLPRRWFTQTLIKSSSRIVLKSYFKLQAEGTENIPDGPFILAPNHQSYLDGLFVTVFLKNKVMKNTYFYAKEKHLRRRWLRAFARRHNVIVMDINRDLRRSLQNLGELLRTGKNLVIFPEGTRTHTGELGRFKKAFAILSRELNVPVVPVSIQGAFEAFPRGSRIPKLRFPHPCKISPPHFSGPVQLRRPYRNRAPSTCRGSKLISNQVRIRGPDRI